MVLSILCFVLFSRTFICWPLQIVVFKILTEIGLMSFDQKNSGEIYELSMS